MRAMSSTVVSRVIHAPSAAVYHAFMDPNALAAWLPPGSMRGVVHAFDGQEGGIIRMSLIYPEGDESARGKTSEDTDTFQARIVTLIPGRRIVWSVHFDSADPAFAGEMIMSTMLASAGDGTEIAIRCDNIPSGIRPEDNEAGCRASLEKLAAFLGG